ncbi:hypothetical protein Leryth_008131 [Lithospermum erythrorhizon]|nr:hypothetical protein Leryth_008131 [Lithospermum erythrorhizon]
MVAIQLSSTFIGISYTEKSGNFFNSNNKFSFSWKPFFGIALKKQRFRNNIVIRSKRVVRSAIIEKKDFEFKPAFDEYLKVLESVKASRIVKESKENEEEHVKNESLALLDENNEGVKGKNGENGRTKRVIIDGKKVKNESLALLDENNEGVDGKSGKNGRHKRVILDGKTVVSKGFKVVNKEEVKIESLALLDENMEGVDGKSGKNGRPKRVIIDGKSMVSKGFKVVNKEEVKIESFPKNRTENREGMNGKSGKVDKPERVIFDGKSMVDNGVDVVNKAEIGYGGAKVMGNAKGNGKFDGGKREILGGEVRVNGRFNVVDEKKIGYGGAKVMGNAESAGKVEGAKREFLGGGGRVCERFNVVDERRIGYGGTKVKASTRKSKGGVYSEDVNDDDMDRAAFKSLNENEDAYDMPRVTRADMEERIQKLAKCLNGADIDMPEWMFCKMMRSAKIKFSDHTILRIIQILGNLGNWKRVLQVIDWIQSRERFKSHKIRYVYTAALDALKRARRPTEALNLFHAMQQQISSYPDRVAYHCIAVILGQAGYMKELFDVIDVMQSPPKKKFKLAIVGKWDPRLEPDDVVYNSVLNACVIRKNWEGAFWVMQQLKQQGLKPSSTTYGLVMEVMYTSGKYNLVHEFFKKVQKSCIPNALTYKVLVNTLSKEGNVEEAILAVEDMERRGIVGTASLYYDLARCLCSAGRCQEALKQIDKICRVASKPLVVTYTGLIQACVDSGDIKSASYIFSQMHNFCSPNLVTYNIMLKAYLDHGTFEEGKQLFMSLLQNVNAIKNRSDCRDKVIPDIYTFNTMLESCAEKQRWDDFEFIYFQMLRHGFHFNPKRHLSMVLAANNAGKREVLEATWKQIMHSDRARHHLLIRAMFWKKLEQGAYATAVSYITQYAYSESPVFSVKSWKNFFNERRHELQKGALEEALVHMQEKPLNFKLKFISFKSF